MGIVRGSLFFVACKIFLLLPGANASAVEIHTLVNLPQAPTLDGYLNEPEWQQANHYQLAYEYHPNTGEAAPVNTHAYIYEDGESLHIAMRAYDPQPKRILAHLSDRDGMWGDDWLGIVLDTFNDERTAYEFYVNALGVQQDGRMSDRDGWKGDSSWNGIWDSAGRITDDGWIVEFSIPFKILRFPQSEGNKTWSFSFYRAYPRDVLRWLSNTQGSRESKCNLCQFDKLQGFASVQPGKNLQLTPTFTLGRHNSREEIADDWETEKQAEPGLDLRWGVTQNSVLNLTLNPDFSQVEADAAQLEVNSTYALFIPERRPFFLDGADYFTSNYFNLVHTRNIAEPDAGIKLTGKNGNKGYGVLVSNDKATSFIIPDNQGSDVAELSEPDPLDPDDDLPIGTQLAIGRFQQDIGERSNIAGMFTHRQADDYKNTLVNLDGNYWFSPVDSFVYQVAYAESENPLNIQEEFELPAEQRDHALALRYFRDTEHYRFNVDYQDIGEGFRADMGFMGKADFREFSMGGMRKLYGDADDFVNQSRYFFDWDLVYDQNGKRLENELKLFARAEADYLSTSEIGFFIKEKYFDNDFNPGEYFDEQFIHAFSNFSPIPELKLELATNFGNKIDYDNAQLGRSLWFRAAAETRLGKHLKIRLTHKLSSMHVDESSYVFEDGVRAFDGGQLFKANQSDLRFNYQFNIRNQLKLILQYTDIARDAGMYRANFDQDPDNNFDAVERLFATQFIYSYKINAQSLFYLGYSDKGFQDDSLEKIEKDYRSVFAKISYAWQS